MEQNNGLEIGKVVPQRTIQIDLEKCRGDKYPTKIIGLDTLLRDGIALPPYQMNSDDQADKKANGIVILIKGKPGTGKTTLALQFATGLTRSFRKKKIEPNPNVENSKLVDLARSKFFSIEQEKEELEDKLLDIEISRIIDDLKNDRIASEKRNIAINKLNVFYNFKESIIPFDENGNWDIKYLKMLAYTSFDNTLRFEQPYDQDIKKELNDLCIKDIKNKYVIDNILDILVPDNCYSFIELRKSSKEEFIDELYNVLSKPESYGKYFGDMIKCKIYNDEINKLEKLITTKPKLGKSEIENIKKKLFLLACNLLKLIYDCPKFIIERENISDKAVFLNYANIFSENKFKCLYKDKLSTYAEDKIEDIRLSIIGDIENRKDSKHILSKLNEIIRKEFKTDSEDVIYKEINDYVDDNTPSIIEEVFNVGIVDKKSLSKSTDKAYSLSPAQNFLNIVNSIEDEKNILFPCVVLDGLNILNDQEKRMINLNHVIKVLKKKAFFSVLIYDGIETENMFQEYLADMVIDLRGEEKQNAIKYFLNDLQISKSRFQSTANGWHQYKIRDFGIQVFKSLHFHIHQNNYMDSRILQSYNPMSKLKHSDDKQFDESDRFNIERILNNPTPGSFTVLLGPRAAFKTKLSLSFLYGKNENAKDKDGDSLLVSLVDNLGVLQNSCSCQFEEAISHKKKCNNKEDCNHECHKCHDNFYIFHIRPGCITPDEFFYYLEQRIKDHSTRTNNGRKITRLVFWDLTQLEYRFPLFLDNPMFLPGLVEFGKRNNIAMCIMGAGNSKLTLSASAIADNVVFCWRDSIKPIESNNTKVKKKSEPKSSEAYKLLTEFESQNTTNKNLGCKEYLAIYVDRCEGLLGGAGRELTFLPIITEGNKQKIFLSCPTHEKRKRFVIIGDKVDQYPKGVEKLCLDKCNVIKVDNIDLFTNAKIMIEAITDLQGLGGVK